jgi:hypothetical protein
MQFFNLSRCSLSVYQLEFMYFCSFWDECRRQDQSSSMLPAKFSLLNLRNFVFSLPSYTTDIFVQALEPATLLLQEAMWLTILNKRTLVHDDNLVEIEDSIKSMRHGDDCMARKLLTQKTLNNRIRSSIETNHKLVGKEQVSALGSNLL